MTHKLRQMVYRIRQRAGWPDIVVSRMEGGGGETTYRLPDGTWCDIWEFEAKLAEADWHSTRPADPEEAQLASTLREEAIELYRGDLDCELGDVATIGVIAQEATRLRERYVGALLEQAVFWQRVALGHWAKSNTNGIEGVNEEDAWRHALRYYMEAVGADRHNESAYVGAMRCHAHLGNWVKVQQVFEICRRVLAGEPGVAPSQLTHRAYEEFAVLCGGHVSALRSTDTWQNLEVDALIREATSPAGAQSAEHPEQAEHVSQLFAILHDVLQESILTIEDLRRAGYSQEVLEAVEYLTPRPGESEEVVIERISSTPLAAKIKQTDLDDNIDLNRMPSLSGRDVKRLEKHLRAQITLPQVPGQKNAKPLYHSGTTGHGHVAKVLTKGYKVYRSWIRAERKTRRARKIGNRKLLQNWSPNPLTRQATSLIMLSLQGVSQKRNRGSDRPQGLLEFSVAATRSRMS